MLETRSPSSSVPATGQGNWLFRGLAHVVRNTFSFAPDPALPLLNPEGTATHSARKVSIRLPDGHGMPGYLLKPRHGNGATVALVHGISAETFGPYFLWIRALLDSGFQVLTFELDGHGENPRELCFPGIDENVPAAIAFMRQHAEIDPTRIGLLGVSLGGACILNAMPRLGDVGAVAVVSTPHNIALSPLQMHLECLGVFNPELLPLCFEASVESMMGFLTRPLRWGAAHASEPLDFLDPRIEGAIRDLIAYLEPLRWAGECEAPVLVVNGEWDQLAPLWQARDLYEAARGPKAHFFVPRRNHFTVMAHRQAIARTIHWFEQWL